MLYPLINFDQMRLKFVLYLQIFIDWLDRRNENTIVVFVGENQMDLLIFEGLS